MSEETFKFGDVVKLKSGGPEMTIINWYDTNVYTCGYFNVNNEYKAVHLTTQSLVKVDK